MLIWGWFILLIIISAIVDKISKKYYEYKRYRQEYIEDYKKAKAKEDKNLKVAQLVDNLANKNPVQIGICNIQYDNETLTIDGDIYNINYIKEFKLKSEILGVWKQERNTDTSYNYGTIKRTTRMTAEEYEKERRTKYYSRYELITYDLDKKYYITITVLNGTSKNYLIGSCYFSSIPYVNKTGPSFSLEDAETFVEMFNETNKFIFKDKDKEIYTYHLQ